MDENGFFYILGRTDNELKFYYARVHPETIEKIINEHPLVSDSLVTGKRNKEGIQFPVVFLILMNDKPV